MRMRHFPLYSFLILALGPGLPQPGRAQEIQPRRWSHLPIDGNFAGGGVAFTEGEIQFDPVLDIRNAGFDLMTYAASYIRTFELLGKSARIDLKAAYQEGTWSGIRDDAPVNTSRSGYADPSLRLAVNLYGAPPLKGKAYREYAHSSHEDTVIGAALVVGLPLGQYDETKLINLGGNRFIIRPQLGVVHRRGKWTGEITSSLWIWTRNDEYWNGNTLEQDPLIAVQGHLIYTMKPGWWASASAGYGYGGEARVNGESKGNLQQNQLAALTCGIPLNRQTGIKLSYIMAETNVDKGVDSRTLSASLSYIW